MICLQTKNLNFQVRKKNSSNCSAILVTSSSVNKLWRDFSELIFRLFFSDQRLPEVTKRSERERKQIEVEVSRSKKWAEMMDLNDPKKLRKYFEPQAKYREKMINRIYKGVPDSVRGRLWYILLDIKELKETQEGVYERMKEVARRHSPDIRQVTLYPP